MSDNQYLYNNILINEADSSIFDVHAQAIVNPCNLVGVAGKGLALEFKERYPDSYQHYKNMCNSSKFQMGAVLSYYIPNTSYYERNETERIIYFPTKLHWKNQSDYSLIEDGLLALSKCTNADKLYSIAIPPLGCGLGGLEKDKVKEMILDIYCPKVTKFLKMLYLLQF